MLTVFVQTLKNRLKVDLCGYKKETAAQKVTMLFSNYHLQGMYHLNNLEGVAEVLRHVPVPMSEKRQQKLEDKKKKELEKKELEQKEQEKVAWEPKVVTTVCEQWKERTEVNIEKAEEKEEQEKQRRRARGKKAFEEDFSDDEEEEKKKEEEDSSEKSEEDDSDDDQEDEDWYFLVNKIMRKAGWVVKKMRKVLKVINTLLSEKISIKEAIAKKKKEEDEKAKKEKEKKEDDDEEEVTVSPPPAKERKVGM